ncbi:MAG: hypothetical protein ABIA93_02170, partial [Candidatus Woesearchaeota archaeon]
MDVVPVHYLTAYAFCPRKLLLKHLSKEKPDTSKVSSKVRKDILRMLNREEPEIVKNMESVLPLPEVIERYKQHYSKKTRELIEANKENMKEQESVPGFIKGVWPRIMREAEQRAEHLFEVMEKTGLSGEVLWNSLIPKLRTDVLVEGLGMRGMIDLVKEYPGEDIPYVFTAKKPPKYGVWESDKLKAGAYILIMQAQGLKVEEARIVYLADKEDAEREVPMNGFLKERILKTRDA